MKLAWALIASLPLLFAASPSLAETANETIIVRGQRPTTPTTPYWFEVAYDQYPALGPKFAKGLIIWNHPIDWTGLGPDVPPTKAIEGMAAQGWDVIRLQRNPRMLEHAQWELMIRSLVEALAQQTAAAQSRGYKRVIVAGQGFGGGIALESALTIKGLYGVIGFAPSVGVGRQRLENGTTTNEITGELAETNVQWTTSRLQAMLPTRLFLVFPEADEWMSNHDRGADARKLLAARGDLAFALVDEGQGVKGNNGADTKAFDRFATCLDYFFEPNQTPRNGEYRCGADETSAALVRMGVKPGAGGGQGWFGLSNRGQETYVELLADGHVIYGTGHGPFGKAKPGAKTYEAVTDDDSFSFTLTDDLTVRGVRDDQELQLTIDLPDKTRASAVLHPVGPVKAATN